MSKEKKKQVKKWTKYRHKVVRNIANAILTPYAYFKYGMRIRRFKEKPRRQYLVLYNHQTAFDQFFVGMAFKGATYYVASEDLFNHGLVSRFIEWAVKPIPIKKQANDFRAVLNCKRVANEGGTIAISPEGNRTYSGKPVNMKKTITGLVRILKLPIAFFRIEGGFGVQPRWSDCVRHGRMTAGVSRIVEYDEYKDLSDDELYNLIRDELNVDEGCLGGEFRHKKLAEHLERCMYVCPQCGLSEFESMDNIVRCKHCGLTAKYLPTKQLEGLSRKFPFEFVSEWYDYQEEFIHNLNLDDEKFKKELYQDEVKLFEVEPYKRKSLLDKKGKLRLFGNRIEMVINGEVQKLMLCDIDVATVLGRNKLNIYWKGKVFQVIGKKSFNPMKYINFCYHYKNTHGDCENYGEHEFLGL